MLLVAVIPALPTDQRPALRAVARRFGWASLAALGVLIATGSALASHDMRWDSGTLQVKLAPVISVAALITWHLRRPRAHAIERAIFLLSLAIVWLGSRSHTARSRSTDRSHSDLGRGVASYGLTRSGPGLPRV